MPEIINPDDDLEISDDLLREVQEAFDRKASILKHPYVFDLIRVLARYKRGMKRTIVLDFLRRERERIGLPIPVSFDNTVQSQMQYYCEQSEVFTSRNAPMSEAIFCWPRGKGAGWWGLNTENARAWVNENRKNIPRRLFK